MAELSTPQRMGALARVAPTVAALPSSSAGELLLAELVPPGQVNLRGDPSDQQFLRKAGAVLGCVLPTTPNSVETAAAVTVLWLGPDEWLVVSEPGAETSITAGLEGALAEVAASVVDVTGNRSRLRLRGAHARDVLAKGGPLDLHPSVFATGRCAQTVLARTAVLLHLRDDEGPTFDLFPRRSVAEYLWLWLEDAMREYGGRALGQA
jgi:sarcosine oxidase, subunit gamma